MFDSNFRNSFTVNRGQSLLEQHGIETIALRPLVATQLGTNAGLLVVYVEPNTPAFAAGLQPGDVIQSIDGKAVSLRNSIKCSEGAFDYGNPPGQGEADLEARGRAQAAISRPAHYPHSVLP